jgi:glycosyltransferase involved in cell wall biosynthesis
MRDRPSRILVTYEARIPSVELGAIIPLSYLQTMGYCELTYKDEMLLSLADIAWCDVLFVVRGASTQILWIADSAKKLQRKVVSYWDDDLLNIPSYSLSYAYYSMPETKENISRLFKITDLFFSPSPKLADKLSTIYKGKVKVLPVAYGPENLKPPSGRNHDFPVVGYAGGLDHIRLLDTFLGPVIKGVLDNDANFNIHIVGPRPDFIDKLKDKAVFNSYIEDYYEYLNFISCLNWDIGLAPQVDCEFTTYKFYNKFLEYTSIGCAGIYSKLEPYISVVQNGVTGLLVDNEIEAWKDAILVLLKGSGLRLRIARNAYEFVRDLHNRKVVAEKYVTALGPFLNYKAPEIRFADRIECLIGNKEARDPIDTNEATVNGKETHVRGLEEAIKDEKSYISHLERIVKDDEATLNQIYSSRGWKLLVRYYRMRNKILLIDSYIRKAIILIFRGMTSFLNHFKGIILDS